MSPWTTVLAASTDNVIVTHFGNDGYEASDEVRCALIK